MLIAGAKIEAPKAIELTLTVTMRADQWAKVASHLRTNQHIDMLELSNAISATISPLFQIVQYKKDEDE